MFYKKCVNLYADPKELRYYQTKVKISNSLYSEMFAKWQWSWILKESEKILQKIK